MAEGVNIPISLDVTDVDISNLDTSQITHVSKIVAKDLGELAKVINQIFKSADLSKFGNTMTTALGNIEKKANSAASANQALVKTLANIGASTAQYQDAVANVEKLEAALREAQHYQKSTEELVMDAQATGQPISKELYDSYVRINQEVSRLTVEVEKAKAAIGNPADWAGLVENLSEEQVDKFVASLSKLVSTVHDAQLATVKYNQSVEESKFTDEYQDKITAIEKLKQKMEDLNQKTKDMQELGATDKQWAKAELEAKKLSTEMGSLITQARELVKTGAAFRFGDADGTGAKEQRSVLKSMSGSRSTLLRNITERSMENRSPFTEEYEQALKVLEQLEKELDKVEEKARKLAYTGGTESQWKGLQFDVENLKTKISEAEAKAKSLVEEGRAFRFGNGDAEAEMGRVSETAGMLQERLASIKTRAVVTAKSIAKAFQQANATLNKILHTVVKLIRSFANLGHTSKKSSNDMNKSLKKLWKNFLMFGLGFRSMYFFIKKLRTTFINEFKLMAQVIPEVNEQISSFMTHVNQLKGSLGTAFQPLMTVVIPALNAFIDAMVAAMNAVGRFFATLTGQGYIYKYTAYQVDYAKSLEGTGKAAEKARRSLMGFDEINRLDADKEKGGGAGAGDNQEGFWEKAPTEDAYSKLADLMKKGWAKSDWTEVGEYLGEGLKESLDHAIEKINGDAKDFGQRVALVLATGINGFIETPGLSTSIGVTIGSAINTGFSIANTFLDTTNFVGLGQFLQDVVENAINEVQWNQVGAYFGNKLRAMVDFAWGFIHDFDFAAAGQAIADAINGFFEEMGKVNPESGLTGWQELGQSISDTIKGITTTISTAIKGIEWSEVGTAIGEMISSIDWSGIIWNFAGLAWSIVCGIGQALSDWHDTSPISASIVEIIGAAFLGIKIVPAVAKIIPVFKGLGEVFSLVAGGAGTLHEALVAVFGAVGTTIAGVVSVVSGAVMAVANFLSMLKNGFSWVKEALMVLGTALAAVGAIILGAPALVAGIVAGIVAAVMTLVVLIKDNWEAVKAVLKQIWDTIVYFCEMFAIPFEAAAALISGIIGSAIGGIIGMFEGAAVSIMKTINGIKEIFEGIIKFIKGVFTGDWKQAWEGVKQIFKGIWDTFVAIVTAPINLIIGLINGMISGFCTGLNFIIKGLNKLSFKVPDWVPGVGGQEWGFNIPLLEGYKIPYLAQGAVIPPNKQFLAMLGDQKSGTNVEAPLATIQQAVADVMGDQLEALAAIGEAVIAAINEKDLNVVIGDREIGRAANRYNNRQNLVKGV